MLMRLCVLMGIPWDGDVYEGTFPVPANRRALLRTVSRLIDRSRFLVVYLPNHSIATDFPDAVSALIQVQHEELDRLRDEALISEVTALHLLNWKDSTTYPASLGKNKIDEIVARYAYPTE